MPQDRAHVPFPPPPPGQSGSDPSEGSRAGPLPGGTYFLGRYRVVDEIGIGGMASVHLARMDGPGGFQKWVAIKRIHPHLVEDETFVNMFLDEARVAARISHPNVATVFELGKHEDTYWIAMEYLHGEPLREVMRRTEELGQPMPPEIACRVIADAAEGLHAAHELLGKNGEKLGLVHRDVTPHNLFVTYDGNTKVVDFGIAKFTSRMANTRAGTLKGKLAYMSPEQVAGEPIDRRTDVFALGVVLWELTTGQRLFRMESDLDTLAKVQECAVPRPSTIVRGYPIDLEKIVMKALAKTKNERYRTAREFSRALQSLLMRRGLFIASDEVAAYMVSVFSDRIQKREAHLRWAAEVTQTIDIDKMKGLPPSPWHGDDGSIVTFNSEVQPSQPNTARAAPRPAAGMPALPSQPTPIASPAPAPASVPVAVHSPPRPAAAPVLSAKSTLRMGAMSVATAPPPAEPPRRGSLPSIDASRSDDPPTLALPRENPAASAPKAPQPVFEDDFDDAGDTIVSDSMPEMDFTGPPRPAGGAKVPSPEPPLGITVTSAASPVAMAAGPRPAPARQPTPPPMPAVMVPPGAATMPFPPSDDTRSTVANDSHLAYPQPLLRGSMSNEYQAPMQPGQPHPGYAQHGPADMQRLFAPPIPSDQRTVTAQALKKRIPLWAVAAGSAAMGLVAFAVVVLLLSRSTHPSAAKPGATPSASASVVVVATPGPFVSARSEFASAVGSPSSQVDNATSPPPAPAAPSASAPAAPPPPATSPTPPIPTANIGSLPAAPAARPGSPHAAPVSVAAAAPASAGGSSGTLKVICFPGCDQVVDNGAPLGPSPVVRHNASVGSHRIKLVWSDSSKVVSTIVIADQTATVRENHP
ncbi:MAG TPA: protein kinase [Polyangiaceae bacterium]|nr:protein kinase [Polyangiaceae bacterium]